MTSGIFSERGVLPPTIGLGTVSSLVPIIRLMLISEGSVSTRIGTAWTPEDMAAAKGWQASKGLSPSGNIDPASWRELLKG